MYFHLVVVKPPLKYVFSNNQYWEFLEHLCSTSLIHLVKKKPKISIFCIGKCSTSLHNERVIR
jgi:hypothetical protein